MLEIYDSCGIKKECDNCTVLPETSIWQQKEKDCFRCKWKSYTHAHTLPDTSSSIYIATSSVQLALNNQTAFLAPLCRTQDTKHYEVLTTRPCGSSFIWQSRIRAQNPSLDASCNRATGLRLPASVTHSQSKPRTRKSAHFLKSDYFIRNCVHCSCGLLHKKILSTLLCQDWRFILSLLWTLTS